MRLVYSADDPVLGLHRCQNLSDHLVIDFLCDPHGSEAKSTPVFKSYSDQNIYVEIMSKYACPNKITSKKNGDICMYHPYFVGNSEPFEEIIHESTRNDEESNRLNGILDLTETAYVYESLSSVKTDDSSIEFFFNFCGSVLNEACNGSICMLNHTTSSLVSLGRLSTAMLNQNRPGRMYYYQEAVSNYILFKNGSQCAPGINYSAEIQLVCAPNEEIPFYFSRDMCRYFFLWKTPLACLDSNANTNNSSVISDAKLNNCKLYNKLHNHTFDLTELSRFG